VGATVGAWIKIKTALGAVIYGASTSTIIAQGRAHGNERDLIRAATLGCAGARFSRRRAKPGEDGDLVDDLFSSCAPTTRLTRRSTGDLAREIKLP